MRKQETIKMLRHDYVVPRIATIEMEAEQILCGSDWNDGSVADSDDNWNILNTI